MKFGDWEVVNPHCNYLGLSYGEWARNWVNWLMHADPDLYNTGPVFFLRGIDFKKDYDYRSYIRLEKQRLFMSMDQALFSVILACWIDVRHHEVAEDHEKRLSKSFNLVTHGDHPPAPEQLTIDGEPFPYTMDEHLIVSPEFKLHIPSHAYGESLGQYLDVPIIEPGDWDCALAGYFVLLKPTKEGRYIISSHAAAENGYTTETLVEVEVHGTSREQLSKYHEARMKETMVDVLRDQEPKVDIPESTTISGIKDTDRPKRIKKILKALERSHTLSKP